MSRLADQIAGLEEDLYNAKEEVKYLNAIVLELEDELEGVNNTLADTMLAMESLTHYIGSVDPDLITAWKALKVVDR